MQLQVTVHNAKPKRKTTVFLYIEIVIDGGNFKTAGSTSSNPKWDEQLTLHVTSQTTGSQVYSHHTLKARALLVKTSNRFETRSVHA